MIRRNHWIGVLWAVGCVLVIGALLAQFWLVSFYYQQSVEGPNAGTINVLQQLANALVVPALIVGFATIAGLLFLHARNHARNHASKVSSEGKQREGPHAPH